MFFCWLLILWKNYLTLQNLEHEYGHMPFIEKDSEAGVSLKFKGEWNSERTPFFEANLKVCFILSKLTLNKLTFGIVYNCDLTTQPCTSFFPPRLIVSNYK